MTMSVTSHKRSIRLPHMRVFIADDHPVLLMGLRCVLQSHGSRFEIVGDANDGTELLERLPLHPCDLLITDFCMADDPEGKDGLAMLRRVVAQHPRLPILVLTMLDNPALTKAMLGAGVRGIVDKAALTTELISAIDAIVGKRIYLSQHIRRRSEEAGTIAGSSPTLSPKEAEVVRLLAQGLTVTEIARRLDRTVTTISQQKRTAKTKLGLSSDKQLYEYARLIGLF